MLAGIATVVKSPGVPREAPIVAAALAQGIEVIGEVELGWRALENEFIALTGSNGKTTTVELIGHIYRVAGLPVTGAEPTGWPFWSRLWMYGSRLETTIICGDRN